LPLPGQTCFWSPPIGSRGGGNGYGHIIQLQGWRGNFSAGWQTSQHKGNEKPNEGDESKNAPHHNFQKVKAI